MKNGWYVLGAGAMGGLFASRLADLGHAVCLLSRHPSNRQRMLTVVRDGNSQTYSFEQESAAGDTPIRHLLVCTKAFDVVASVGTVAHRIEPAATVVLMANGMGYHNAVSAMLSKADVCAATTSAGCHRPSPDLRIVSGEGQTHVGRLSGGDRPPEALADWLTAPWPCQWQPEIEQFLLRKLAINAVINPATALHDIANGSVLEPPWRDEFDAAIREVVSIFANRGLHDLATALPGLITEVARDTDKNVSSMRADLNAGRPMEVEAILGFLLETFAGAAPPPTPTLNRWLNTLRQRQPDRE